MSAIHLPNSWRMFESDMPAALPATSADEHCRSFGDADTWTACALALRKPG